MTRQEKIEHALRIIADSAHGMTRDDIMDTAKAALESRDDPNPIHQIALRVSNEFLVEVVSMKSRSRTAHTVLGRFAAMYLASKAGFPQRVIGPWFNRERSDVSNAVARMEGWMLGDVRLAERIKRLEREIVSQGCREVKTNDQANRTSEPTETA